ncbi:helix-turn-helix transcriptional regulator [Chitinophaga solisilvae]|uniref:Helix-turn-helix transcriptional regulator n=1 Tax=Chitinophaga solisilvae TaxID=1233460 RepID=A0A433WEQ8_9BACT|nr:helix-turn-helix transcriptional regulator [Chitinophaga solisilvae]NSL86861.1 helix-turn-helix transcriptional regulator [Chitinophaga solisilvae]
MSIILSPGNYFGNEQQFNEDDSFKLNITIYQPETHIHEHYHENAYLSLLINGSYEEVSKGRDTEIAPGEILFRPAGYSHANNFHHTGGKCLNIEFKEEWLRRAEVFRILPDKAAVYKAGTFDYLYRLLYAFSNNNIVNSEEYMLLWLSEFNTEKIPERLPWLPQVKAILENEFEVHHTIKSIAARVFVHPVYLARAFKEREGITIGDYQLKMRLRKAAALLFTTTLPVTDIAFTAGFSDAPHLVRAFRANYHTTPHKFRSLLKS